MKISNILWGLVFVFLGIILGLNALDITHINFFFEGWWTLFLIVPSLIGLVSEREKISNLIILLIGILLFLSARNIINFQTIWKLFLPIILVLIGLYLIFKNTFKKSFTLKTDNNLKEYAATFSSQNLNFAKEKFENCHLTSVFGDIKLDLRECDLKKENIIKVEAIFGGITILVPDDCLIKVGSNSLFGGVSNKKKSIDAKKIIYIEATCLFGGVDIK